MGITIVLGSGDFVHDTKSGDIGFLISKHFSRVQGRADGFVLIVWRIYWCRDGDSRYTEESIINMIRTGHLVLHAGN